MLNRSLPAVIVLVSLCVPLAAETAVDESRGITSDGLRIIDDTEVASALTLERRDLFGTVDDGVLLQGLQAMTVLDPWRLPTLPDRGRVAQPVKEYRVGLLSALERKNKRQMLAHEGESAVGPADWRVRGFDYGGEVGFYYGRSTGKYGAEEMGAYIISGAGNDKFNIEVGVSYQETSYRGRPSFR